ncbi:hypothetical protein EK21DRAFT_119243 [Setomelanomma holmii]|uniref:Uncharacterized protein n=1 Tax=Setomelanomma holmii TaxID=210430 RepID=A0A9P4GWD2_9PLEO|nr:hypothetical protein EK21DRAFT_119243 [Setomelanomma holmii]
MFTYLAAYKVLICLEHQHAVYSLDEHLKRHYSLPVARRRELLAVYAGLSINATKQVSLPAPNSAPIAELGPAQGAFLCCQEEAAEAAEVQQRRSCSYVTTNRKEMRKHTNQQQNKEQQQQQQSGKQLQSKQQQSDKQQESEQQSNYEQRLAYLSSSLEALKSEDSEAIDRIAEETSAKDHWKLLAYAIRSPRDDEPELQQVEAVIEQLVEQAVQGLSTLAIDTLRWLRSAKATKTDVQLLGRMQNKESQQRAARLWARLLCYCIRLAAAEEQQQEEEQQQQEEEQQQQERGLQSIACLFP